MRLLASINETIGINDAISSLKKKSEMRLDISLFSGKTILKGVKKMKTTETKKEIVRYKENPFIENMSITVRKKQVKISKIGKDDNILVNQGTGEVAGTMISTFKKVDDEQFLKLFTANIALTFDLKAAGIKAFNVICWLMQNKAIERDQITIDKYVLEDFNDAHNKKLSKAVLYRGLDDLISNKILARCRREGDYFINPAFMFNGDRIVFATVIERKLKEEPKEDEALTDERQ